MNPSLAVRPIAEGRTMKEVAGAILVLAGSVLIAAGIVADALTRDQSGHGNAGYLLGAAVGIVGIVLLLSGTLRRAWDSIPVDDKPSGRSRTGTPT
jgi:drug/metabolite transporter (DMT)-like permease